MNLEIEALMIYDRCMRRFLFILTWLGIALIGLGILITSWAIIQIHEGITGLFSLGWLPYTIGTLLALTGAMVGRFYKVWPILAINGIIYCMFLLSVAIWSGSDMDAIVMFLFLIPGLANIVLGLVISQLKKRGNQRAFQA